jgi:hypothetical protein
MGKKRIKIDQFLVHRELEFTMTKRSVLLNFLKPMFLCVLKKLQLLLHNVIIHHIAISDIKNGFVCNFKSIF